MGIRDPIDLTFNVSVVPDQHRVIVVVDATEPVNNPVYVSDCASQQMVGAAVAPQGSVNE